MSFAPTRIDVGSIAVIAQPASTTTSVLASSFPPRNFASSPDNHGLTRTGLKAASDESSFSAVMDAITFRLHNLSISKKLAGQAIPAGSPVYIKTSTPAEPTAVGSSLGRKILKHKSKLLAKCTQSIRASFKKTAVKRASQTKKSGGASRPPSQCASETDPLVGLIVDSMNGRSVLAALEANQPLQVTRFREMFSFEVREPAVQWVGNTTFPPPTYLDVLRTNALSTMAADGDGTADVPMQEDVQQQPLPQPASPAQSPWKSMREPLPAAPLYHTTHDKRRQSLRSISADVAMDDVEDGSSKTGLPQQKKSASKPFINSASTNYVSSTPVTQDVDMKVMDNLRSVTSLQQASIPFVPNIGASSTSDSVDGTPKVDINQGQARTIASTATAGVAPLERAPPQPLSESPLAAAPGAQPPAEVADNRETHATPSQVTPIQPAGRVSTSTPITTSNHLQPLPTPSPTATNSTAGPSTPTQSPQGRLTPEQVQPTQTHANRLHQVLGRWGLSKPASKSLRQADSDEASEQAEAEAFFAKRLAAVRPPVKAKSKPEPVPTPSEPKPTKGSAARSLMDDIMAGLRGSTKPKSSRQQAPAAAHSPTQSNPPASNVPRPSPAVQRPLPVVAGRQRGPQPTLPCHVGTGPEATAPGGSSIPSSRAPSTVPTIGKANGPRMGNPTPSAAALPEPTIESSNTAAMDGVEAGRRVFKGSRRVARAIAKTGWTWETTQQKAREAQAAQNLKNNTEEAPPPPSSLRAFEERVRSSAWHAVQPPPPPEAIPYVGDAGKVRRGA